MSEVQEKQKAVVSESEPEKVSNELNVEDTVADGNSGKDKVDPSSSAINGDSMKNDASGSEPKTPSKNVDVEMDALDVSKGKGKIEENDLKENDKVTTPGSKKRKSKKVLRPKNKVAKKADTATASSVKLDVEVPKSVSEEEKKAEENTKEENKEEEKREENKEEENKEEKDIRKRKRKRKTLVKKPADLVPSKDASKPESSKDKDVKKSEIKDKDAKKSENKGMIFMCSSKTKQDCYNYKVFGLPANKKDTVAKIYKGMRLFLFDIDLKLLYGVYKAEGPGGYNIEPKAFKSAFPSQVRFTMMEDCLPLAEENFKAVIKDNYYARNKFGCNLNGEQVRNLCKLFKDTTAKAGGTSNQASGTRKPEARPVVDRSGDRTQGGRDKERRQSGRDADRRKGGERDRRKSGGGNDRYIRDRRPAPREERREAYPMRLLPLPLPQPQPQLQPTYAYERPPVEYYRRGETSYDRQVDESLYAPRAPLDPYLRRDPVPLSYHESLYATRAAPRETLPTSRTYPELLYTTRAPPPDSTLSYHDPVYTRDQPSLSYLPSHPTYHRY